MIKYIPPFRRFKCLVYDRKLKSNIIISSIGFGYTFLVHSGNVKFCAF